jgi:hypothetical protein
MTLSLVGFRQYRAAVRNLLAAAGHHPSALSDRAMIAAWLADQSPTALVAHFADRLGCKGAGR